MIITMSKFAFIIWLAISALFGMAIGLMISLLIYADKKC